MTYTDIALQALADGLPLVALFFIPVVIDAIFPTIDQEVTP